jgi:hypothetical protein
MHTWDKYPARPHMKTGTLNPYLTKTALCFLNDSLSPCPFYCPTSSLQPSVLSTALYLLYSHLSTLHPYTPSMAFFSPLSPLQPSDPS